MLLSAFAIGPSVSAGDAHPIKSPEVICREAWGAKKPGEGLVRHTITRITVHHSGALLRDNRRAPARLRSAQAYHQRRGWPDIAYHFLVDGRGNIYEGRPLWARGDTGTRYDTTSHLLICLVGDYDKQDLHPAQEEALLSLLAWASQTYKVPAERISSHKDHARTSCPGRRLYGLVGSSAFRARLAAAGEVQRIQVCGEQGTRRVAAIAKQ